MNTTNRAATEDASTQETETGLDENVASALSYVLGFLTGIIIYLLETENDRVRFHAAQSMVVFGGIFVVTLGLQFLQTIVSFMDFIGVFLGALLGLASFVIWVVAFVIWVYLLVRTYQGSDPRIPVAAGIADDFV